MVIEIITGVFFYPKSILATTGGSIMHAIKGLDDKFQQFGECYFSTARAMDPKAWKKHSKMTCNLFVPIGAVKFVFFDDRPDSKDWNKIIEFESSSTNFGRLVISPGIWFGFSGMTDGQESLIVNLADIAHDPAESLRLEPQDPTIPYTWRF